MDDNRFAKKSFGYSRSFASPFKFVVRCTQINFPIRGEVGKRNVWENPLIESRNRADASQKCTIRNGGAFTLENKVKAQL